MSMGQQLGSATKPDVLAGMTPAAGNKALPGGQPGKPPANQLQQAMMPTTAGGPQAPAAPPPLMGTMRPGMGPVAPQPLPQQNIQFESRPGAGLPAQNRPQPVVPGGGYGMPVQTMNNAVRNSQQNMNTNIQQGRRR